MDLRPHLFRNALHAVRPKKQTWDPESPQGFLIDEEPDGQSGVVRTATYFLTGAECRFACAFCDLWKYTLDGPTPTGSLVRQIYQLHEKLASMSESVQWLKLYNASNFFDATNVPSEDVIPIAHACRGFQRVVVENHAALLAPRKVRDQVLEFAIACQGELEIAMGLESIDPNAMPLFNKQLHLSAFESACEFLNREGIRMRAFVMLQPPGTPEHESVAWAVKSCRYAFSLGVERCGIVPTRLGNGWLDSLRDAGQWSPPNADQLEHVLLALLCDTSENAGVAMVDLWDWEQVAGGCPCCRPTRFDTLQKMNRLQKPIYRPMCPECETS